MNLIFLSGFYLFWY